MLQHKLLKLNHLVYFCKTKNCPDLPGVNHGLKSWRRRKKMNLRFSEAILGQLLLQAKIGNKGDILSILFKKNRTDLDRQWHLYFGMRFWILRWTKLVSWRPWPASWPYWFKPIKRITSTNGFFLATKSFTFAIVKCFRIICGCMNPWTMWMWQCENFLIPPLISVAMKEVCLPTTTIQSALYTSKALKWYIGNDAKTSTKTLTT